MLTHYADLPCYVALYLLPLRHPVLVARQLASIAELAPGRLTFGVGIGGEDPHELEICGVDPRTRGRRMDESLEILRELSEADVGASVVVVYKAVGRGKVTVAYGLTRGENAHAYAARRFVVSVT
jgi:alkanesulfonate monooxygenase SsuD/methylene tetrahydromethanopterin reductase-like flavin-dependent oxidoreductase (luciferase family)